MSPGSSLSHARTWPNIFSQIISTHPPDIPTPKTLLTAENVSYDENGLCAIALNIYSIITREHFQNVMNNFTQTAEEICVYHLCLYRCCQTATWSEHGEMSVVSAYIVLGVSPPVVCEHWIIGTFEHYRCEL